MSDPASKFVGCVWLVGAGPGDPGLITVAGLDALRRADAVVYDALANPLLLDQAPPAARRIDVGKRARDHTLTQDQTNALLVDLAREGLNVVRLKGGDPYLFGRGAEEAAYLAEHRIPFRVVPGITSGIAAPMYAGIPVTHRATASSVTFVTGHEDPTKPGSNLDYEALAKLVTAGGTLCFYMGIGRLQQISDTLIHHGASAATPVAVVQWGTLPTQRSLRTTLHAAADQVEASGIKAPAIVLVGQVVQHVGNELNFFETLPLFGQRVLVTRTRQQASALRDKLQQLGASVIEAPTIEVHPPDDWSIVDDALQHLNRFDWLVVTSPNAVTALRDRLAALQRDGRALAPVRIAAIGDATLDALRQHLAVTPDLVPPRAVGEALAAAIIPQLEAGGSRVLLLRADLARPALPEALTAAGAAVTELTLYQTRRAATLADHVLTALRDGAIDWVTFTSSSTATNLAEMLGNERHLLDHANRASIGPQTSTTLRELNLQPTIEADTPSVDRLVAALVRHVQATPTR